MNFQMIKLNLEKTRGTRDQIANIRWIIEKAREFQKNIYLCAVDNAIALVWITTNCGKFFKKWEYQTSLHVSWETCMQVKKHQLEPDIEQWTGSKLGKEYEKVVYCHPAFFSLYVEHIMWNTVLDEAQAEIKIAGRNINNLR